MTRDEMLALPAGEELDAAVAEHIMGFRWFTTPRGDLRSLLEPAEEYHHDKHPCWPIILCEDMSLPVASDGWRFIPKFSTDVAAAWRIMELLRGRFSNVSLHAANGWGLTVWDIGRPVDPFSLHGPVNADAAPLAICRTALLAVTEDKA